jgi:pimeloyl-ACP methyl ester carboxylesterase
VNTRAPTLCLLPGLDGTGHLYRNLVRCLDADFEVRTLAYDSRRFDGYSPLADALAPQLPRDRDFVLIAESFAGPLAAELAGRCPQGLRALVLAASFVSSPLPASRLLAGVLERLPATLPPGLLLERMLAGRGAGGELRAELQAVLRTIPTEVLRRRALAALRSDAGKALASLQVPVLYLQGTRDRLIGRRAGNQVLRLARDAELRRIDAPHFLFQVSADAAVAAIAGFLERRGLV